MLSGTPTTEMTETTYTYTATNSAGSDEETFTLTVNPREGAPVLPAVPHCGDGSERNIAGGNIGDWRDLLVDTSFLEWSCV